MSIFTSYQTGLTYFQNSDLRATNYTPVPNQSDNQDGEISALLDFSDHEENRNSSVDDDSCISSLNRFWIRRQATSFLESGKALHKQFKFEEALKNYIESLKIHQKFKFDTAKIGELYCRIGRLKKDQKKPGDAIILFQKSLAIFEQCAPKSMHVADVCYEMGSLYEAQDRLGLAMEKYNMSASIYDDCLAETHSFCSFTPYPNTESAIYVYCKIGERNRQIGQIKNALIYFQKCINLLKHYPCNLILSDIYYMKAKIHRTQNMMSEAIDCYKKSKSIFQSLIPINRLAQTNYTFHNSEINSLNQPLLSDFQANTAEQTTDLFVNIERTYNFYHAMRIFNEGLKLSNHFQNQDALKKYEECLSILEKNSPFNIAVAHVCNKIGLLHLSDNDSSNALKFFERAFKLQIRLVPISLVIADTYANMASAYNARGQLRESKRNIDQSEKIKELCEQYGSC